MVAPVTLALLPGSEFHQLWGSDERLDVPRRRVETGRAALLPAGRAAVRFGFFTIPPDGGAGAPPDLDLAAALRRVRDEAAGHGASTSSSTTPACTPPPRSTSASCSRATAILELDDGATVTLGVGDTYIQNGTRHRWSNTGDRPAVLAVALVGADHRNVGI